MTSSSLNMIPYLFQNEVQVKLSWIVLRNKSYLVYKIFYTRCCLDRRRQKFREEFNSPFIL